MPDERRVRVALATCAELPALDADSNLLKDALERRDIEVCATVWDDPRIDWDSFHLVVVRSCWDYATRRDEFVAWARRVPRLANPAAAIAWNTDKHYLRDLDADGIPTLPTIWLEPGARWRLEDDGDWVVKPAVSLAALDTGRYRLPAQRVLATDHVHRLLADGRAVMLQPYQAAVDEQGETSLVYLGGMLSHAIRKPAVLDGPDTGVDRRFRHDGGIAPAMVVPTRAQVALADRVLRAALARVGALLYARVDLIPSPAGPVLMELELTEPQLFLGHAKGSADRLAVLIDGGSSAVAANASADVPGFPIGR
jgi:hypothetical protein